MVLCVYPSENVILSQLEMILFSKVLSRVDNQTQNSEFACNVALQQNVHFSSPSTTEVHSTEFGEARDLLLEPQIGIDKEQLEANVGILLSSSPVPLS